MEYMECNDDPMRTEILEQLQKRELHVPNIQKLTMDQLKQIYSGFIVSQPRRDRRERPRVVGELARNSDMEMPMEMEQLSRRIQVVCMAGEKRVSDNPDQQLPLTSSSKRVKIDAHR